MKNITNNAKQAKITMLLNGLVLVFFVISMIFLLNFDKKNRVLISERSTYEFYQDAVHMTQQPFKQDSAEVDYYKVKLDTLNANKPADKKELKTWQEEVKRVEGLITEKEEKFAATKATIDSAKAEFSPVEAAYGALEKDMNSARGTYMLMIWLTIALLIVKIVMFAWWNYKNSKNLHAVAPWMAKGNKPFWAFVGWLVPVYNFIKPFSFFNEIFDETNYVLNDKGITKANPNEDNEFFLGLWWGFLLICFLIISWFIHATFFTEGAMFVKLNHTGVVVAAIVFWAIYLLLETYLINKYNGMNKKMVENSDKF